MSDRGQLILAAWNDAWGRGDIERLRALVAPGYRRRTMSGVEDLDAVVASIHAMRAAFPDLKTDILQMVEGSGGVALHWQSSGCHEGHYMGVDGTGRTVTVTGATFMTFEHDLLIDESTVWDPRDMLSRIGIWRLEQT